MLKWLNNKKKDNKGFSLVELIIVVAIMAILVGLLAPQYLKYVEKSRKSADATNLDEMVNAVQVYAADADAALPAGTYTITIGKNDTSAVASNGGSQDELENALKATVPGYATTKLKSNKWPDKKDSKTMVDSIKAVITADSEGGTTVEYTPETLGEYVNKATTAAK